MEIRELGTGRAVEVDERGRPVDAAAIERRGLLVVGRRLRASGQKPACDLERRALLAVNEDELRRVGSTQ